MSNLSWRAFIDWVFMGLLSFVGWRVISNIDELTKSVNGLNSTVATSIYRLDTQAQDIKRVETKSFENEQEINVLEKRVLTLELK